MFSIMILLFKHTSRSLKLIIVKFHLLS